MPYHHDVTANVELLRAVVPSVVDQLYTAHPHLLTALVSTRIGNEIRELALDLVADNDITRAKRLLGVAPWLEQNFAVEAMGAGFKCCETDANFGRALQAALPPGMDVTEQAACLLIVTDAVLCSTQKAGLILADAHRQAYEIHSDLVRLIGFALWAAEHPSVPLAGLMRGGVHLGSTFGAVVADTLGVCQFMIGYLRYGRAGPRPVLPPHRHKAFDVTQICQPSEACDLARELGAELGPVAYDHAAAGHLGRGTWAVVVRDTQGAAIGVAPLHDWHGALHVGRAIARDIDGENSVRAGAAETVRLAMARGGPARFAAMPRDPPFEVLETRWNELTGPYRRAHPHLSSGPIQAFDPATVQRLEWLIELMSGMAARV